jgi:hypothetical protein
VPILVSYSEWSYRNIDDWPIHIPWFPCEWIPLHRDINVRIETHESFSDLALILFLRQVAFRARLGNPWHGNLPLLLRLDFTESALGGNRKIDALFPQKPHAHLCSVFR